VVVGSLGCFSLLCRRECKVAFCYLVTVQVVMSAFTQYFLQCLLNSVLWHCWLGVRKSIQPVKDWVMRSWRGYLSGVRYNWFAYGKEGVKQSSVLHSTVKAYSNLILQSVFRDFARVWWHVMQVVGCRGKAEVELRVVMSKEATVHGVMLWRSSEVTSCLCSICSSLIACR